MDDAACRVWLEKNALDAEYNLGGNVKLLDKINTNYSPNEIAGRSKLLYDSDPRAVPVIISRNTADRIKNNSRPVYLTKSMISFFIAIGKEEEFKNYVRPEGYSEENPKRKTSWKTFWIGYFLGVSSVIVAFIIVANLFGAK